MSDVLIVGSVSTKAEADELTFIAKHFFVGQRARTLGRQTKEIENENHQGSL